jgi:hypothetical protein
MVFTYFIILQKLLWHQETRVLDCSSQATDLCVHEYRSQHQSHRIYISVNIRPIHLYRKMNRLLITYLPRPVYDQET